MEWLDIDRMDLRLCAVLIDTNHLELRGRVLEDNEVFLALTGEPSRPLKRDGFMRFVFRNTCQSDDVPSLRKASGRLKTFESLTTDDPLCHRRKLLDLHETPLPPLVILDV